LSGLLRGVLRRGLVEVRAGFACGVAVGPAACRASGVPPAFIV